MANPTKYYSGKQEKQIADALGWQVVAGSGAAPCVPGDVIGDNWLGECKTHTSARSIYFNHDVWDKIKNEAVVKHRKPVLFTDDGSQLLSNTWSVCLSNSVELNDLSVIPLPLSVKKNISFDHYSLAGRYRIESRSNAELVTVYSLDWLGESIYVMPFSTFERIVGEQG